MKIGNDCWIAANVTILSGVTIGDGAVIGNSSFVVNDVQPYSIHGGVPNKHLKNRFSDSQVDALMKIKWWSWPDYLINQSIPFLCSDDIDEFIAYASQVRPNN